MTKYVLSVSQKYMCKKIYSSNFNTEGNKWPRITLHKRNCLCEAKLQVQLDNTTTIEYESVSL